MGIGDTNNEILGENRVILYEVPKISVIQSDIRALPRIDYGAWCAGTSRASMLRNRFSAGLKYQIELQKFLVLIHNFQMGSLHLLENNFDKKILPLAVL